MPPLDDSHDPTLRCWVPETRGSDFPIQNLPLGVFRCHAAERWRGGVAIGAHILDLAAVVERRALLGTAEEAARLAAGGDLNALMAAGSDAWQALRRGVSTLLRGERAPVAGLGECLVPLRDAAMALPAHIGDFTDFFTSEAHMRNAGRVFQPGAPPLPNFKWLPIAYHGRASTVSVSPARVRRPWGQSRTPGADVPRFAPCERLDYELELGAFIGPGNAAGTPIPLAEAHRHLFGLCLLNDWSARDLQAWESMPLGPFLSKNFATTISPWIVTLDALAPYRVAAPRSEQDPPALPHLREQGDSHLDIQLEVWIARHGRAIERVSRTSYRHAYWSLAQMVAHHTGNGCSLRPGDLLGTGTQSGPQEGEEGCLLEMDRERQPYLGDGDCVTLRAFCERPGFARIGFGECRAEVLPALPLRAA